MVQNGVVTLFGLRFLLRSSTMTESKNERNGTRTAEPIQISIHPHFYQLPGMALLVGTAIGLTHGARGAGLQFQAENVHRPPTTLRGWYLYRKTKNYKVILGGLKEGGKLGSKLGLTGVVWVGAEEALTRAGWDDIREVGAGLFIAGMFSAACELECLLCHHSWLICWQTNYHGEGIYHWD
jgi:hypothetical protein